MPSPFGSALGTASIRQTPEDFRVTEIGSVTPSGEGEHVWLWVRKRGENTEWVARQLARLAGVKPRDVSYAGLKDRWAVTEQWFSVHLPGSTAPDWQALNTESISVIEACRHNRKLRRGVLQGNRFDITLRNVGADLEAVQQRFHTLQQQGWPNYFGEQRFGHDAGNLALFDDLVSGRARKLPQHKKSLAISSARSYLFNRILALRVMQGYWNQIIPGDVLQLDGRSALFAQDADDTSLAERLEAFEIHPTAPLWGRGRDMAQAACRELEQSVLGQFSDLAAGLEKLGAELDRRSLRVWPQELQLDVVDNETLRLRFTLPAGSYATVLIEQLVETSDTSSLREA